MYMVCVRSMVASIDIRSNGRASYVCVIGHLHSGGEHTTQIPGIKIKIR